MKSRQEIERVAIKLVGYVQGTSALEGQAVDERAEDRLVISCIHDLEKRERYLEKRRSVYHSMRLRRN